MLDLLHLSGAGIILLLAALLPYLLTRRFLLTPQTVKAIYPALILWCLSMFFVNLTIILRLEEAWSIYEITDLIAIIVFLTAVAIFTKRAAPEALLEAELSKVREWVKAIMDHLALGIVISDRDGNVLDINRKACEFFGIEREKVIGRPKHEAIDRVIGALLEEAETFQKVTSRFQESMEEIESSTWKMIKSTPSYIRRHSGPIYSKKGEFLGRMEIYEEVTEEMERKEQVKELNEQLRILIDVGRQIVSTTEIEEIFRSVCRHAVETLGSRMAWIGTLENDSYEIRPRAIFGAEDGYTGAIRVTWDDSEYGMGPGGMSVKSRRPVIERNVAGSATFRPWRDEAIKRGYRSVGSFPIIFKDEILGILAIYSERQDFFTDARVEIFSTLASHTAIALKNASLLKDLSDAKEEWERVFDSISDFVYIHDDRHRIVRVNRPLKEKLNLPFTSIVGEECKIMEGIFFNRGEPCPHKKVVETGLYISGEVSGEKGETYYVTSYPYMKGERRVFTIHIARDVSAYRKLALAEEEKRRLEEMNRFKTHFVSLVSHELRTPLTSLMGFTELLMDKNLDKEKERRYIYIIHEEAKRLSALVNDILDLSRIEAGKLELHKGPFSIDNAIRRMVDLYSARLDKHRILVEVDEGLPPALGDREKVEQVLGNLLDNAIKYSPDGGCIKVSARQADGVIEVEVMDEGIGIPKEYLNKIFEPFGRVDTSMVRTTRGTGLGLTISKKIVELHGGRMWVESTEGKGSRFFFTLPVYRDVRS